MPDVPFLSDFPRAITITDDGSVRRDRAATSRPTATTSRRVLATLAYFDVAILGRRASAPALFSVGLMDETCPPSTVYAAFNRYGGPKEIREYPFNDHEGGEGFHEVAKIRWLAERLGGWARPRAVRAPPQTPGRAGPPRRRRRSRAGRGRAGRSVASRPSSRASDATAWSRSAVNGATCGPATPVVTA